VLPWTVAAFLLYLAVFLITMRIHVPRTIRALACTAALACLAWGLAEYAP
jgi:hypothetical protein